MQDNLRLGALHAIAAAAAFSITAACVRAAAAEVGTEVVVFFRNAVGLLLLLPWVLRRGAGGLGTARPGGHLARAVLGLAAMYCFFYAVAHLQLAEAILLTYSTPLFIPFIAWLWIREPPPAAIFPALALGMLGLGLIVQPGPGTLQGVASGVGLLSGVFAAAAMVSIRRLSDTEPAVRIVFHFSALSAVISAVPLLWAWHTPPAHSLLFLAGTGVFATLGQLALTRAYSLAAAARIGAFTYVSVVFAGLLGWALWDERPDAVSVLGAALVIVCCVLAARLPRRPALTS